MTAGTATPAGGARAGWAPTGEGCTAGTGSGGRGGGGRGSLPPCVHRFEVHGTRLAFDAGSGTLMVLDDAGWRALGELLAGEGFVSGEPEGFRSGEPAGAAVAEARRELERLCRDGLLLSPVALPERPEPVLKALCLHVSHRCQMSCAYCFASGGDYGTAGGAGLMSAATARAAVDFLLQSAPRVRRWALDFFGGEPLLNWRVVRETILYAEARAASLGGTVHFTLTTNGLGLTPARLAFLDEHGVDLIVSVDGRPEVHDAVRRTLGGKPTWSRAVRAARLAASTRTVAPAQSPEVPAPVRSPGVPAPALWVRGTYTRRNLDFARDALFLFRQGLSFISLEPVSGGPPDLALRAEDIPVLEQQYESLALLCAEHGLRFYHFELDPSGGPCLSRRMAACGAGSEYLAVTPEGDLYACHQLVGQEEFRVGDVWSGISRPEVGRRLWQYDVSAGQCASCWARFLCGGGCRAAAFFEHGDVGRPPSLECALQKKRWECALWLAARRAGRP